MNMPQEVVFYQDVNATVTNARVIIAGRMYPTAQITSVGIAETPVSKVGGWVMIAVGLLTALCFSLSFIPDAVREVRIYTGGYFSSLAILGMVIGFALVAGGIVFISLRKPKYLLRIGVSFMESDALLSPDRRYLESIAAAINAALTRR